MCRGCPADGDLAGVSLKYFNSLKHHPSLFVLPVRETPLSGLRLLFAYCGGPELNFNAYQRRNARETTRDDAQRRETKGQAGYLKWGRTSLVGALDTPSIEGKPVHRPANVDWLQRKILADELISLIFRLLLLACRCLRHGPDPPRSGTTVRLLSQALQKGGARLPTS